MNASETFKNSIENFLKEKAVNDTAFAPAFAKPSKNIEQCIKHIISGILALMEQNLYQIRSLLKQQIPETL